MYSFSPPGIGTFYFASFKRETNVITNKKDDAAIIYPAQLGKFFTVLECHSGGSEGE